MINDLMDDFRQNPGAWLMVFGFLAGLFAVWVGLCWCGWRSVRAGSRRRMFWLAIGPVLFGLIGVLAKMPFAMDNGGFRLSVDLGWGFAVPLLLGVGGLTRWWKAWRGVASIRG